MKKTWHCFKVSRGNGFNYQNVWNAYLNWSLKFQELIKKCCVLLLRARINKREKTRRRILISVQHAWFCPNIESKQIYTESYLFNQITKITTSPKNTHTVMTVKRKVIFGFAWFAGGSVVEGTKMLMLINISLSLDIS